MNTGNDFPEFAGRPVHSNPLYKKVGFLVGDFGDAVHDAVMKLYGRFDTVSGTEYGDGMVKNHGFHYIAAVNEVVRPHRLRIATLADYKNIRGRGQPSDWHEILCQGNLGNVLCGFVLRGDGEPNSEQASRLMAQIKQIYVKSLLSKDGFREN